MRGIIRKGDILLGIVLVLLCAAACYYAYSAGRSGSFVEITVNGEVYGTYSLSEDEIVDVDSDYGHNTLTIRDGKALMTEASCPDGYCLSQYKKNGGIDASNQTIVCLPNRVSVSIRTDDESKSIGASHDAGEHEPDVIAGQAPVKDSESDRSKGGEADEDQR